MEPLIKVDNISKAFGDKKILQDLSMSVESQEIVVLIGSSGSGKSTLVRCIAGLEDIDSGKINISGKDSHDKSNLNKIGMVFQGFNLFPHYTVLENISKPLQTVKKMKKSSADRVGLDLLKKVHLENESNQYPCTLSGGQKQRVAIARALAMEPEIIIFDEPTSSLDPELALEVFSTIQELAREGQTMIIVTHQINAIKHIATRVVFLSGGDIKAQGNVDEMLINPKEKELREFIETVDFEKL